MKLSLVALAYFIQTVAGNFLYQDGTTTCGSTICPEPNWYRYYSCSKDSQCELQLQVWLLMILISIAATIICSLVCSLLRCLCCGCCDR